MQSTNILMCYICGPYDPNSGIHMAKRYKEFMPKPKIYILDKNIGHWPQLEDQKAFIAAYLSFANHFKF